MHRDVLKLVIKRLFHSTRAICPPCGCQTFLYRRLTLSLRATQISLYYLCIPFPSHLSSSSRFAIILPVGISVLNYEGLSIRLHRTNSPMTDNLAIMMVAEENTPAPLLSGPYERRRNLSDITDSGTSDSKANINNVSLCFSFKLTRLL